MKTKQTEGVRVILDLCGGTGAWSAPYKEAGYDVRLVTLPDNDVRLYAPPKNVYGILAAPPCTMFSFARTTAKTPRDFTGAMEIVSACLNIIWVARAEGSLKFWALENPRGYLRQFLGRPALSFQPYEFGDRYSKKTDIWGYFKKPRKNPVELTPEELRKSKVNTRLLPPLPDGYRLVNETQVQARRAITPQGFAKAFYKANL